MQETQQAVLHTRGECEQTTSKNVMTWVRLVESSWLAQFDGVQTDLGTGALIHDLDV